MNLPNPKWFIPAVLAYMLFFYGIVFCHADCSRDINLLTPDTKSKFLQLKQEAQKHGIRIEAICTYRSPEDQKVLYEKGRINGDHKVTWVKHSRHSDKEAFDVAVFEGASVIWNPDRYIQLGNIAKTIGGLTWGGDWKVRDYGHFELKKGK